MTIKISWFSHACFLIETDQSRLLIDPFLSENKTRWLPEQPMKFKPTISWYRMAMAIIWEIPLTLPNEPTPPSSPIMKSRPGWPARESKIPIRSTSAVDSIIPGEGSS